MKTLFTLLFLLLFGTLEAQEQPSDTIRFLKANIDNIQLNLNKYHSHTTVAFGCFAVSGVLAIIGTDQPIDKRNNANAAYGIASLVAVMGIINVVSGQIDLRRASIQVNPTGFKIKF